MNPGSPPLSTTPLGCQCPGLGPSHRSQPGLQAPTSSPCALCSEVQAIHLEDRREVQGPLGRQVHAEVSTHPHHCLSLGHHPSRPHAGSLASRRQKPRLGSRDRCLRVSGPSLLSWRQSRTPACTGSAHQSRPAGEGSSLLGLLTLGAKAGLGSRFCSVVGRAVLSPLLTALQRPWVSFLRLSALMSNLLRLREFPCRVRAGVAAGCLRPGGGPSRLRLGPLPQPRPLAGTGPRAGLAEKSETDERRPSGYCSSPKLTLPPSRSPVPSQAHLSPRLTCATGRRMRRRARAAAVGPFQPAGSARAPAGRPFRTRARSRLLSPSLSPPSYFLCGPAGGGGALGGARWAAGGLPGGQGAGRAAAAPRLGGRARLGAPGTPGRAACVTVPTWPLGAHVTCGQVGSRLRSSGRSPPPAPAGCGTARPAHCCHRASPAECRARRPGFPHCDLNQLSHCFQALLQ